MIAGNAQNNRISALREVVSLSDKFAEAMNFLSGIDFDSEAELVTLERQHIESVLYRFLTGEISAQQVEEWASFIEGRDDIGFEDTYEKMLMDAIYVLATPELEGKLDENQANKILAALS